MLAEVDTLFIAIMSSVTTVIVALIAAGFFKTRVMRSLKNIENATNHVEEGQPTLIERVNMLRTEQVETRLHLQYHQNWVINSFKTIANEIGVRLPPYENKDDNG